MLRWLLLSPHETKEFELDREFWDDPWDPVIGLSFTDSWSRRWKRYPDGRLVKPGSHQRRSRKDYMNAWITGGLDRLDY